MKLRMIIQQQRSPTAFRREVIGMLQQDFPGFDRQVLSHAENSERYGVTLTTKARAVLANKSPVFAKKQERRKLPCRVYVRLSESDFAALQQMKTDRGYATMQDLLYEMIKKELR